MVIHRVTLLLVYMCSFFVPLYSQCVRTNISGGTLPLFNNYGSEVDRIFRFHQAIIPSYQFSCCGEITEWGVDVEPGGGMDQMKYTLDFQVWRPSPTVNATGCFSLVGNNRFTSVQLRGNRAVLTPLPTENIQFLPGDVLGFYVENARSSDGGVALLNTDSYTNIMVWYGIPAETTSRIGSCPYSVGLNGNLATPTNAAPVISIATTTYMCPSSSSVSRSQATPMLSTLATSTSASQTFSEVSTTEFVGINSISFSTSAGSSLGSTRVQQTSVGILSTSPILSNIQPTMTVGQNVPESTNTPTRFSTEHLSLFSSSHSPTESDSGARLTEQTSYYQTVEVSSTSAVFTHPMSRNLPEPSSTLTTLYTERFSTSEGLFESNVQRISTQPTSEVLSTSILSSGTISRFETATRNSVDISDSIIVDRFSTEIMSTTRVQTERDGKTSLVLTQQTSTVEIFTTTTQSVYNSSTLPISLRERSNSITVIPTEFASSSVESRGLAQSESRRDVTPQQQSSYTTSETLSTLMSSFKTISSSQSTLGQDQNLPKPSITTMGVSEPPVNPSEEAAEGGIRTEFIIAIVLAIIAFIVVMTITFIIAMFLFNKRNKSRSFDVNRNQMELTFTNQLYDLIPADEMKEESNDFAEHSVSTTARRESIEKIPLSMLVNGGNIYDETEPGEAVGPKVNTSSEEQQSFYALLRHAHDQSNVTGTKMKDTTPVYEDPSSSAFPDYDLLQEPSDVFDQAGVYVPTTDERASWKDDNEEADKTKKYNKPGFFVKDETYWAPASTTSDLYAQLARKRYREIKRSQLTIHEPLGSGEFGEVSKGVWSISGATKVVAVKTLRPELSEEEKVRFLQEAAIMGQFSHPNVVKIYGVVTVGEPTAICLELMSNGDLLTHLDSLNIEEQHYQKLGTEFVQFSKQIAAGMRYLASKSFVHRDLAARNVLLDIYLTCKIGDFGMARDLMNDTYYTVKSQGSKIPVRWTAPEALLYKKYSTDSDVWSYGMVLFEIWSIGKKPFSALSNNELVRKIDTGYNQPPPPGCPRAIYQLMVDCWNPMHAKRPHFSQISEYLSTSTNTLLQWREEDEACSVGARKLGAPLEEAESLYKDLQNKYIN